MAQFGGTIVPLADDARAFPVETGLTRYNSVLRSSFQDYAPIGGNGPDGAAIFELQTGQNEFLDLGSSYFTARVRLEEQDAGGANAIGPADQTATITPTILASHAKFSRIVTTVNGRDVVDEYSAGAYPYLVLARDSLVSPGPSTVPRGWEEFEFWILPGPNEANNALAAAAAAAGTIAAAAAAQNYGTPDEGEIRAGTAALAADLVRFTSAAAARRNLIFTADVGAGNPAANTYVTIAFRPRGTLWETGSWLPDNLRLRCQFMAATHPSMMCMGNGTADGTGAAARSGTAPTMTFEASSFRFQARLITLKPEAQATLNAYRTGAAGGVPRPLVYPFNYIRVAERSLANPAGAAATVSQQLSGVFGGVIPDLVVMVPVLQASKARAGAIPSDPFDTSCGGAALCDATGTGNAYYQINANGVSFPKNRVTTLVGAYQQYCEACAHSGFLTGSTLPALTFRQWVKRPIYCALLRDDGEAPWGRATEMERKGSLTVDVSMTNVPAGATVTLHIMGWSQAAAEFTNSGSVNLLGVGGSEQS